MSSIQKSYQAQQFAKHHYRKLLSAKSSLNYFKPNTHSLSFYPSRTLTPLDKYQYSITNLKLSHKLNQIYSDPPSKLKRKHKNKHARTMSVVNHKPKSDSIQRENVQIFQRILAAKSAISQDWKKREKDIKRYRNLSRKKINTNQSHLFNAFREILVQNRSSTRKGKRPATSRPASGNKRPIYQ